MNLNPLSLIEKLINEHGSASILGKHLSLIKDQLSVATKKVSDLEKENAELADRIGQLEGQLKKAVIPVDFVEYRGVLFRRLKTGDYEPSTYCLDCKSTMFSLGNMLPFKCSKCGFSASFNGHELGGVIKAIP